MPSVTPDRISLPDRYRVIRHLANGGMASVWEAHDELLGRDVAVKLLASHLGEDERARKRFQREARAAAGLSSHPHVVTIYDVGEHQNRVFMVMEIMRGGTIGDRMRSGREIDQGTILRWLREAAGALDTAHDAGVVHRDIKPGNLLLDDHDRLAVADFGIARLAWEDQLTATGQVLGTAAYLSPEQALGEPAAAASDRYALAVVAYELLTGSRPFEAEHFAAQARAHVEDAPPPASERAPDLSRAVDAVLERGLAKDPKDRWETAVGFVAELDRTLGKPDREPTRPTRKLRRGAAAAAAAPPPARAADTAEHAAAGGDGRDRRPAAAPTPAPEPRRRGGAPLLAALGALALLAVIGVIALANRGGQEPQAESTPTATPTAERTEEPTQTATAEPTDTPTPAPTDTPAPEPEPTETATPESAGEPDLEAARTAQLAGYNARQAGDYETALAKAREAQELCGASKELSPCGFALYEEGVALTELGQPDAAIPVLERRLEEFGDNESGEVEKALRDARKAARKGDGKDNGDG